MIFGDSIVLKTRTVCSEFTVLCGQDPTYSLLRTAINNYGSKMTNRSFLKTTLFTGVLALLLANPAHADDWYLSIQASYSDPTSKAFNDGTNGGGNPKIEIDSAVRYGVALGREIIPNLKLEIEYTLASYETDSSGKAGSGIRAADMFSIDSDLDVDLLTLGISYEFANESSFTPFVKGGLGTTFYDIDADLEVSSFGGSTFGGALPATFSYKGDGNEFAYFLGAGVSFEASEALEATLEYRYSDLGEVATDFDSAGDRIQTDLKTNNVQLGLRYYFN